MAERALDLSARAIRAVVRAVLIFVALQCALAQFLALRTWRRRSPTLEERTLWLHDWCRRTARLLGIRVLLDGRLPRSGLLVSNHLSYLDIVVFGAMVPTVFIAKIEVRSWLLFGLFAKLGGAIFIDRWNLRRLPGTIAKAEAVLRAGALLTVFPEATTTDGSHLLPFRPALFEAAVRAGVPVTRCHIWYTLHDGTFGKSLCWYGDVKPVRNIVGAFAQPKIWAHLHVGGSESSIEARKPAAASAHRDVLAIQDRRIAVHSTTNVETASGVTSGM